MAAKKKINLEELKMEQLKKVLVNIENISDLYQNTQLRIMLIQALGGIHSNKTETAQVMEGREALDNTITKENNIPAEETVQQVEVTPVQEANDKTQQAVNNIKNAIEEVLNQPEETYEDPEVAPVEVAGIDVNELNNQEDMIAESNLGRNEEEVQAEMEEAALPGSILTEDFFIDAGDGTQVNIKDTFNALQALPDDEAKQYIAFYLAYYDAESVAAIVNAFSSEITSDAFELLNANNYMAFLEYFNACLQG